MRRTEAWTQTRTRLDLVLASGAIRPVFQPIVELANGHVHAYEAMARFPGDPSRPPERWFAEAWQLGRGIALELLAAQVMATALEHIPPELALHVNASPATVASPGFLHRFHHDVDRLTVEIPEDACVTDLAVLDRRLVGVRASGAKVAIDHVGASGTGLPQVLEARPEWIKLDFSLTGRVEASAAARALVAYLTRFAVESGAGVVAEGIENHAQLEILRSIGVGFGQGHHLGRPAPLNEALARDGWG